MSLNRTAALVAALTLVVSAVALPGLVAADEAIGVTVEQQAETGDALVSVTVDGEPVENATVVAEADDEYVGNGSYETDVDGSVTLPNPAEEVAVTLTVSVDGTVRTVETDLVPREDSLAAAVDGDDESATVTVTQYGDAVENATVAVEAADGESYADEGEYQTDANGTVELAVPEEPTDVVLNVSSGNLTAERTVTLGESELELDVEQDDGVTVEVTRNDSDVENATVAVEAADGESYADEGEYQTDANGTVDLATPDETVNVTVTVTDDDDVISENVTLENDTEAFQPFGSAVSAYVQQLISGASGGIGDDVSEFARENNPGNADDARDDDRGPSKDVPGEGDEMRDKNDDDSEDEREDEEAEDDDSEDEEDEEDEETEDEREKAEADDEDSEDEADGDAEGDGGSESRGPPSHANN